MASKLIFLHLDLEDGAKVSLKITAFQTHQTARDNTVSKHGFTIFGQLQNQFRTRVVDEFALARKEWL
jgi:hypothetical protein